MHEWCSRPDTEAGDQHVWVMRSCTRCLSVQGIEALSPPLLTSIDLSRIIGTEWTWEYRGANVRTCQHDWEDGVSLATEISCGQVVLVRKGDAYGAFKMTAQRAMPEETASYMWRWGTDAGGGFDTNDPNVDWSDTPEVVQERMGMPAIVFGPFEIEWSGDLGDKGWIYYEKSAADELSDFDLAICVTGESEFEAIRAADPGWRYMRSPVEGL